MTDALASSSLSEARVSLRACSVWGCSLFFVWFQFFIQMSSGQIVNQLMQSFNLTALGGGFLASAYYYVYVALQTPAGLLMGEYGPRKLLTAGAIVLMLGSFIFASTHWIVMAFIGRMLMGLGAAFAFVGTLYVADKWFPQRWFSFLAGVVELGGMTGVLVGLFWLAHAVQTIGWRDCMYVVSVLSGFVAVLSVILIRDRPPHSSFVIAPKKKRRRILPGFLILIRMRIAWINGIYAGILFTLITVFASLWGLPFIEKAYHLNIMQATFYCSLVYVGTGVVSPMLGYVDTQIVHRRYLMSGFALLGVVCLSCAILLIHMPLWMLGSLLFLVGMSASGYMLTFAVGNQIVPMRIRSASVGFVNTLAVGLSPIFQPLLGGILYWLAKQDHPLQMNQYTVQEYQLALLVLPLFLAIAAILALFIPSRR